MHWRPPRSLTAHQGTRLFALAALLLAASMGFYHLGIFVPNLLAERARKGLGGGYSAGNDFYPIWLTSREWFLHGRDPYSPEMTRSIQKGLFGRALDTGNPTDPPPDYRTFSYPVYVDLLAAPLARLSFPAVRWILACLLPVLMGCSILLWLRFLRFRPDGWLLAALFALTLFSFQVLEGLYAQQAGLVAGFLLAGSMAALRSQRPVVAGCLLGLSVVKPQMGILLIFCLVLWASTQRPERKFVPACLGTIALLLIVSTAIWGNWIPEWLAVIHSYKHYGTPALVIDLLGPRLGWAAVAMLLAGTVWLGWRLRAAQVDSAEFAIAICTILAVTSLALVPGHALYDRVILLPGILLAVQFRHELRQSTPALRMLLALTALALFWQWIFSAVVVLARMFLAPAYWNNVWFLRLPIRTVGTVPFAVLGLLALAWRDLRQGKLKLESATPSPSG